MMSSAIGDIQRLVDEISIRGLVAHFADACSSSNEEAFKKLRAPDEDGKDAAVWSLTKLYTMLATE